MEITTSQVNRIQIELETWKQRCGSENIEIGISDRSATYRCVALWWKTPQTKRNHSYIIEMNFTESYLNGGEPSAYIVARDGEVFHSQQRRHPHIYADGRISEHPTGWSIHHTTLAYGCAIFEHYLECLDAYLETGRVW